MAVSRKTTLRVCVGCRQMRDKKELIRVVRTQDGEFCIDQTGKKNGRGAYVCKNPDCLALAIQNHGLERSFRTKIPKETADRLKEEMSALVE